MNTQKFEDSVGGFQRTNKNPRDAKHSDERFKGRKFNKPVRREKFAN